MLFNIFEYSTPAYAAKTASVYERNESVYVLANSLGTTNTRLFGSQIVEAFKDGKELPGQIFRAKDGRDYVIHAGSKTGKRFIVEEKEHVLIDDPNSEVFEVSFDIAGDDGEVESRGRFLGNINFINNQPIIADFTSIIIPSAQGQGLASKAFEIMGKAFPSGLLLIGSVVNYETIVKLFEALPELPEDYPNREIIYDLFQMYTATESEDQEEQFDDIARFNFTLEVILPVIVERMRSGYEFSDEVIASTLLARRNAHGGLTINKLFAIGSDLIIASKKPKFEGDAKINLPSMAIYNSPQRVEPVKRKIAITRDLLSEMRPRNASLALWQQVFKRVLNHKDGFYSEGDLEEFVRKTFDELVGGNSLGDGVEKGVRTKAVKKDLAKSFASLESINWEGIKVDIETELNIEQQSFFSWHVVKTEDPSVPIVHMHLRVKRVKPKEKIIHIDVGLVFRVSIKKGQLVIHDDVLAERDIYSKVQKVLGFVRLQEMVSEGLILEDVIKKLKELARPVIKENIELLEEVIEKDTVLGFEPEYVLARGVSPEVIGMHDMIEIKEFDGPRVISYGQEWERVDLHEKSVAGKSLGVRPFEEEDLNIPLETWNKIESVFEATKAEGKAIVQSFLDDPKKVIVELKDEALKEASPVTPVDKAVEAFIRRKIKEAFGSEKINIIGEEEDSTYDALRDVTFVIDPIDGTNPFLMYLIHHLRKHPTKAPELLEKLEKDLRKGHIKSHGVGIAEPHQVGLFGIALSVLYKGQPVRSLFYAPFHTAVSEEGLLVEGVSYPKSDLFLNGSSILTQEYNLPESLMGAFPGHKTLVSKLSNFTSLFTGGYKQAPSSVLTQTLLAIASNSIVQQNQFFSHVFLMPYGYAYIWDVVIGIHFTQLMGGVATDLEGNEFSQLDLEAIEQNNFKLPTVVLTHKKLKDRVLEVLRLDMDVLRTENPEFLKSMFGLSGDDEQVAASSLGIVSKSLRLMAISGMFAFASCAVSSVDSDTPEVTTAPYGFLEFGGRRSALLSDSVYELGEAVSLPPGNVTIFDYTMDMKSGFFTRLPRTVRQTILFYPQDEPTVNFPRARIEFETPIDASGFRYVNIKFRNPIQSEGSTWLLELWNNQEGRIDTRLAEADLELGSDNQWYTIQVPLESQTKPLSSITLTRRQFGSEGVLELKAVRLTNDPLTSQIVSADSLGVNLPRPRVLLLDIDGVLLPNWYSSPERWMIIVDELNRKFEFTYPEGVDLEELREAIVYDGDKSKTLNRLLDGSIDSAAYIQGVNQRLTRYSRQPVNLTIEEWWELYFFDRAQIDVETTKKIKQALDSLKTDKFQFDEIGFLSDRLKGDEAYFLGLVRGAYDDFTQPDLHFLSTEVGASKNNDDIFERVLERLRQNPRFKDIQPNEILFLDDSSFNIEKATDAGFNAIQFQYGVDSMEEVFGNAFREKGGEGSSLGKIFVPEHIQQFEAIQNPIHRLLAIKRWEEERHSVHQDALIYLTKAETYQEIARWIRRFALLASEEKPEMVAMAFQFLEQLHQAEFGFLRLSNDEIEDKSQEKMFGQRELWMLEDILVKVAINNATKAGRSGDSLYKQKLRNVLNRVENLDYINDRAKKFYKRGAGLRFLPTDAINIPGKKALAFNVWIDQNSNVEEDAMSLVQTLFFLYSDAKSGGSYESLKEAVLEPIIKTRGAIWVQLFLLKTIPLIKVGSKIKSASVSVNQYEVRLRDLLGWSKDVTKNDREEFFDQWWNFALQPSSFYSMRRDSLSRRLVEQLDQYFVLVAQRKIEEGSDLEPLRITFQYQDRKYVRVEFGNGKVYYEFRDLRGRDSSRAQQHYEVDLHVDKSFYAIFNDWVEFLTGVPRVSLSEFYGDKERIGDKVRFETFWHEAIDFEAETRLFIQKLSKGGTISFFPSGQLGLPLEVYEPMINAKIEGLQQLMAKEKRLQGISDVTDGNSLGKLHRPTEKEILSKPNLLELQTRILELFESAGLDRVSNAHRYTEVGLHYATPVVVGDHPKSVASWVIPAMGVENNPDAVIVELGHGQGENAIRWAYLLNQLHPNNNFKIIGMEYDLDLYEDSLKLLDIATKRGFLRPGQIEFLWGDYNGESFESTIAGADVVYYFALGTSNPEMLAKTLDKHLTKPGARVLEYGLSSEMEGFFRKQGAAFEMKKVGTSRKVRIYTRVNANSLGHMGPFRLGSDIYQFKSEEVKQAWEYVSSQMLKQGMSMMDEDGGVIPAIFSELQRTFQSIDRKIDQKRIRPNRLINVSKQMEGGSIPVPVVTHEGPTRVGVYPFTANPMHWGHIAFAFTLMDQLNLDQIVFLVHGQIGHKRLAENAVVPDEFRHKTTEEIMRKLGALVQYSNVGVGNSNVGEFNIYELLKINPNQEIQAFYLTGSENEKRVRAVVNYSLDALNQNPWKDDKKHKIVIAMVPLGEEDLRSDKLTQNKLDTILKEEKGSRTSHALDGKDSLDIQLVDLGYSLEVHSTDYRNGDRSLVPHDVDQAAQREAVYGYSLGNNEDLVGTLNSLEQPTTVFMDGEDVEGLSLGQLNEMFTLAYQNPEAFQVVVANASHHKHPMLDLPNIHFTSKGFIEASRLVRRTEHNLHLSIKVDPPSEFKLIGDNKFRYPDHQEGLLGVALLFTQAKDKVQFMFKYGLARVGDYISLVEAALLKAVQSHLSNLVTARAA